MCKPLRSESLLVPSATAEGKKIVQFIDGAQRFTSITLVLFIICTRLVPGLVSSICSEYKLKFALIFRLKTHSSYSPNRYVRGMILFIKLEQNNRFYS
jgi:hypothetical protein